jgi:hypothetical protein
MDPDKTPASLDDIPGWFPGPDQRVFTHFLSPDAVVPRGDLVELGVYLGKSAVLMGDFKADDETFTVCDLFGASSGDDANDRENASSYRTLDRQSFERNYLALHDELPVVVQGLSSVIVDHVKPDTARFVHIDASHLYEHVAIDVESARHMLLPDGVVCFDDFRSPHTPGVAAAVWEAVWNKGLNIICVTSKKLYGTFGDPVPHQEKLREWLAGVDRLNSETQVIGDREIVRISARRATPTAKAGWRSRVRRLVKRG